MYERLGLFLGILTLCVWLAYFAVYQVDDAFIVYRYAQNLAQGQGFVYNPGERVEGVTCFLWALVLVPFGALRLPLPLVAPILTALCGILVVRLLPGIAARLWGHGASGLWNTAAAVLLAAHPSFAYWSVGGLETVPYTLLLLLALCCQLAEQERGSGRRSAIWLGLASLMRPEAPLVAAGLLLGRALDGPGRGLRGRVRDAALWSATIATFFVPFLLFRRLYFGDWLPNTYYARTSLDSMQSVHDGRIYSLGFLSSLVPGFGSPNLLTEAGGVLVLLVILAYALPRPGYRSAALLICGLGLAVLLEGGDWMVLYRFWVPALPATILLIVSLARAVSLEIPRVRPYAAAFGVLLLASFVFSGVEARDGASGLSVNEAGYRFAHHRIADYLKAHADPGDVVALMDIGRIGYETGLRVIDISGLTEREIARAPGGFLHKRYPVELLLERSPRFFVLVSGFPIDDRIMGQADFVKSYRLVLERNHRFNWTPPDSYVLRLYERAGRGGP